MKRKLQFWIALLAMSCVVNAAWAATSGTYGNVNWALTWDDDIYGYILTITPKAGTDGRIPYVTANITNANILAKNVPWFQTTTQQKSIKKVIVREGVTYLGSYAFASCINLTSVELPNSLTTIGEGVFKSTTSLKSVNLPEGLEEIGLMAFLQSGLETITIPNGVTHIKKDAFHSCHNLTAVTLPTSIEEIGQEAFANCSNLHYIKIPEIPENKSRTIGQYIFRNTPLNPLRDCSGYFFHDGAADVDHCNDAGVSPDEQNRIVVGCEPEDNNGAIATNHPYIVEADQPALFINDNQHIKFSHLIMRAIDEEKPVVMIDMDGMLTMAEQYTDLWYEWKVKIGKNYFACLPTDVYWDDIKYQVGPDPEHEEKHIWSGDFGMNFYEYDGKHRAENGYNSETRDNWKALTGRPMTSAMDLVPSAWRSGVRTAVNYVTGNSVSTANTASTPADNTPAMRRVHQSSGNGSEVEQPGNPTPTSPSGSAPVGPLAIPFAVLLGGYGAYSLRKKEE